MSGPTRKFRILVAEDESLIALDLEEMLKQLGYEVLGPAADVGEIRELIRQQRADGAILDINLRGEPVFAVLPALQTIGLPIILASGYDDPRHFPPEFREMPRITKPFTLAAVRDTCARCFKP